MADYIGRDDKQENPAGLDCEGCEALLADKMDQPDGLLRLEDEGAFNEHVRNCPGCSELLEQARQGQKWLRMLSEQAPPAPGDLLRKILARTQGGPPRLADPAAAVPGAAVAGWKSVPFLPQGFLPQSGAHQARLLMTGAMAFFSIALTLSITGVRLTSVHAAELRPQVVQANVSRSFYGTKKQVVSFYENLRVVYEVESKMRELRGDASPGGSEPVVKQPGPAQAPAATAPSKKHAAGATQGGHASSGKGAEQVAHGWPVDAAFELNGKVNDPKAAAVFRTQRTMHGARSQERNSI